MPADPDAGELGGNITGEEHREEDEQPEERSPPQGAQPASPRGTSGSITDAVTSHTLILASRSDPCIKTGAAWAASAQPAALGLERLPALELSEQRGLDLLEAFAVRTDLGRTLLVIVRRAHARGEGRLLVLQRFDLTGK